MTVTSEQADTEGAPTLTFESIDLRVGTRVQLLIESGDSKAQHFTTVIGYVVDEYLLLRMPVQSGRSVTLHVGERVLVRMFSGVRVISFNAHVERVLLAPLNQLYLSYPDSIRATAVRSAMRIRVELTAQVSEQGSAESKPATIVDLSSTGARFVAATALGAAGAELVLKFSFVLQPGDFRVDIETTATLRNVAQLAATTEGGEAQFGHGVAFALDPTQQVMVQNLIYEAMTVDRQRIV
jgi:c-di-GMP-binding flagellar brake protein YcgR